MTDKFRTEVHPAPLPFSISHKDRIALFGSCFSENIGNLLSRFRFQVNMNSHGILFNPESIATAIEECLEDREYKASEIENHAGIYLSLNHHGKFNSSDCSETLGKINEGIRTSHIALLESNVLLITFGSAWVYRWKVSGKVVANCHKIPQSEFTKTLLSHAEISARWSDLILKLRKQIPNLKVIFTISPVRHWRDGVTENQVSKSHLFIAIHEIIKSVGNIHYFPAYEIVLDDLRDYRFYKEDMIHPNDVAIRYVWSKFSNWIMDAPTLTKLEKLDPLLKYLEHRPLHTAHAEHEKLLLEKEVQIKRLLEE